MANFRILYEEEGRKYIFSSMNFKSIVSGYVGLKRKTGKYTKTELFKEIAQSVNVSLEAVKQWYGSYNGPADIEIVKAIASVIDIDFKELLVENKQERLMDTKIDNNEYVATTEIELIKEVYKDMYSIAEEYSQTGGGFILSMPELRDSCAIYNYYISLVDNIHCKVDRSALSINNETLKKLHIILMEYKQDITDILNPPSRWIKVNTDYYRARHLLGFYLKIGEKYANDNPYNIIDAESELFDEDGCQDREELEILLRKRLRDIEICDANNITVDASIYGQDFITSLKELYLREFADTMVTIFNLDFNMGR